MSWFHWLHTKYNLDDFDHGHDVYMSNAWIWSVCCVHSCRNFTQNKSKPNLGNSNNNTQIGSKASVYCYSNRCWKVHAISIPSPFIMCGILISVHQFRSIWCTHNSWWCLNWICANFYNSWLEFSHLLRILKSAKNSRRNLA